MRISKIYRDRFSLLYHRLRASWPVWYYFLNRESRRTWHTFRPALGPAAERVVASLESDGIALARLPELFPESDFLFRLQRRAGEHRAARRTPARPKVSGKGYAKEFMRYLWGGGGTNPLLELDDPFVRLALDEGLLGIVGAYLGLAPKFHGFSLQETVVIPAGTLAALSQRWHRDPDDKKLVKVFLYLSDVADPSAGPFMYVKGSHHGGRWRSIFPQRPPAGFYPPAGAVEGRVPSQDILTCLGSAGTLIFCDTSGLHKGGYSTIIPRLMFTAGFVSRASCHPINFERPPSLPQDLSPLARYALEP